MEIKSRHYLLLHPRPVYIIGSGKFGREANLMAASWVIPVSEEPPKVVISIDRENYTYELIEKYGEFTVNVVEENYLDKIWFLGTTSGRDIDKVAKVGLTVAKGRKVDAPIIKEAIGIIEAKVSEKIDVGECRLYIGDIVYAEADESKYSLRYGWNLRKTRLIYHLSGKAFMTNGRLIFPKMKKNV